MADHGSFYPIDRFVKEATPVLFAFVTNTPAQREAVREEMMARLTAIAELSETLTLSELESPDPRSHCAILEAVAILSRDVRGLLEASFRVSH
ncbi:hypothetical protein [Tahibacter harae]|uniref:Uncharacterized protein n=1 Tax=Tahibacter harae TaxID=2963937 RepID=A0ABT1QQM2_9GAMM|nr:hypothetical protein [Tahibacter harae]MCQ4164600.1 hypothetical protein [Tahibacter harae]